MEPNWLSKLSPPPVEAPQPPGWLTQLGANYQQELANLPAQRGISGYLTSPVQETRPGFSVVAEPPQELAQQHIMDRALSMLGVGMTHYHGSPHQFEKFDLSKIGTGEGAQAYGHGLYFAESPGVAKSYQNILTEDFDPRNSINKIIDRLPEKPTVDDVMFELRKHPSLEKYQNDSGLKKDIIAVKLGQEKGGTVTSEAMAAYRRLDSYLPPKPQGSLYEVDIPDEAISKMLDWDKPLSEQPESVRNAIKQLPGQYRRFFVESNIPGSTPKMGEAYSSLANYINPSDYPAGQKFLSEELNSLGIPGIKYLDATSRTAGEGTRNLVVFDDKLPKILKRNNQTLK